mgnify:CR=1 FL=1
MKKELCSIAKKGIRKIILSCGLVGRRIICILDLFFSNTCISEFTFFINISSNFAL